MKKQIVMIHGAQSFSDYAVFLEHLRTVDIKDPLDENPRKRWQSVFREELQDTHEVYMPSMPNKQNAKYEEWKIWFERYHAFLRDDVVLIGHSQGGYFLVKYLTENTLPIHAKALYLLAVPFGPDDFGGEDGGDFTFDPLSLPRLSDQVREVYIFHAKEERSPSHQNCRHARGRYSRALYQVSETTLEICRVQRENTRF